MRESGFDPSPAGTSPAGGSGNQVHVNVINNAPGTTAQATKRKSGDTDIHEIIVSSVDGAMANGRFDSSMRARFGQQVQARGR